MLYTPSHAELAQHPKTRKLARLLGVSIPTAIGHLHLLWHFALKYASDGDLSRFTDEDIADGCMWEGGAPVICNALHDSGYIDVGPADEPLRITLHDWQDYGGKAIKQKEDNAKRQQEWRDRHKTVSTPSPNKPVTVTSPLYNALEEKRIDKTKGEESIYPPSPRKPGEGGGVATPRNMPASPTPLVRPAPKPKDEPPRERPRDLLFEAVCEVCLIDWHQLTDPERGKVNAATGQIRKAGATPADVPVHAANYRAMFTTPLTPPALAGNWATTANAPPPQSRAPNSNGRRMTVEERNIELENRYTTQENGHEPDPFPEAIDVDWHGNEQGTQPRPLRPVVAEVRRAPR